MVANAALGIVSHVTPATEDTGDEIPASTGIPPVSIPPPVPVSPAPAKAASIDVALPPAPPLPVPPLPGTPPAPPPDELRPHPMVVSRTKRNSPEAIVRAEIIQFSFREQNALPTRTLP